MQARLSKHQLSMSDGHPVWSVNHKLFSNGTNCAVSKTLCARLVSSKHIPLNFVFSIFMGTIIIAQGKNFWTELLRLVRISSAIERFFLFLFQGFPEELTNLRVFTNIRIGCRGLEQLSDMQRKGTYRSENK